MSRLPTPGQDSGQWGSILNDYLSQAHNSDGTLKDIPQSKVANLTSDITTIQAAVAQAGSDAATALTTAQQAASATIADASVTKSKLSSSVQNSLDKADSAYIKPSNGIPATDLDTATQAQLSAAGTIADNAITTAKLADGAVSDAKLGTGRVAMTSAERTKLTALPSDAQSASQVTTAATAAATAAANKAAIAGEVVVWATSATTWETLATALARCGLSARPAAPARVVFDSVRFADAVAPTEQMTGDTWRKVRT